MTPIPALTAAALYLVAPSPPSLPVSEAISLCVPAIMMLA
jgi:hypothetical protein